MLVSYITPTPPNYYNPFGAHPVQGESTSQLMNRKAARWRLPVELYRPILLHLDQDPEGRRALLNLLVVSKAMSREVLQVIYHTLDLNPDKREPIYLNNDTAEMVRSVHIKLGLRQKAVKHTQWCMSILPRLTHLERMEIRGRAWEASVFDSCLPRRWDSYEGITGVRSFTFDGSIDLPVIRFLAAQRSLTELEIVGFPIVPFSSADVVEIFSTPYAYLTKITIPHSYAKAIIRLAPALKHLSLTFDFATMCDDVSETLYSLPPDLHSLIFDTTRRDFLPAHALLPHGLRMLSTVFVQDEADQLLLYLSPLKQLQHVILNIYQTSTPSFINPFAPGATAAAPQGGMQGFDNQTIDRFIKRLKWKCPSIKMVQVDDQVYHRTGNTWVEGLDGTMSRRGSHTIHQHRDGSAAQLWRASM